MEIGNASLSFNLALLALRFRTRKPEDIPLSVEAGNEHRATVSFTFWLIQQNDGRFSPLWRNVSQALTKTSAAKPLSAAEKFNRVICVERRNERLHGSVVLVTKGQEIGSHPVPSLASEANLALQSEGCRIEPEVLWINPGSA